MAKRPLDEYRVRELYATRSIALVASILGVPKMTLRDFMAKHGIERRRRGLKPGTLTPSRTGNVCLDEMLAIDQYAQGWSLAQVALEHRCSTGTIRAVIKRHGYRCRNYRESHVGNGPFGRSRVRLTDAKVVDIRERAAKGESWTSIGKRHGVSRDAARLAGLGITWRHVPMVCSNEATKVA